MVQQKKKKKKERQREKSLASHTFDKKLISRIYKEPLNAITKRKTKHNSKYRA